MKRVTLLLLFAFLVFTLAAAAQSSSNSSSSSQNQSSSTSDVNPQSNSGSQNSSQSGSMSPQSGSSASDQSGMSGQSGSSASQSGSAGNMIEGCVVQEERDYYIQPVNGGNRMRLRGSHDFSADVGHQVRAEGTANAPNSQVSGSSTNAVSSNPADTNATKNSGTSAESSGTSSGTGITQDFIVNRVTTVSETCPANSGSSGSGSSTTPHR